MRRKDPHTLVLSYNAKLGVSHVLIEVQEDMKYHVIKKKKSKGHVTLGQCLHSLRKHATHGLLFNNKDNVQSKDKKGDDQSSSTPANTILDLPLKPIDESTICSLQAWGRHFYNALLEELETNFNTSIESRRDIFNELIQQVRFAFLGIV